MSELMSNGRVPNTTYTFGYIDSASITHVVQAYDVCPKKSFPCGWTVPRLVTSLLISTDNFGLAPGTGEKGQNKIWSKGPIGDVTRNLLKSGIISRPSVSDVIQKQALQETQNQAIGECENLKRRFNTLRQNDETHHWMDWSIRSAWEEHAQNFGSLVDKTLIPQLARILNVTDAELSKAHEEGSKPKIVKNLVKKQPNTELFKMIYDCFLLGALLRGLYHDLVASYSGQQISHHPLREAFLPPTEGEGLVFDQTKVENYLTNIVLWDALQESTLEGRLLRWANNIGKIRNANKPGYWDIDLRQRDDPDKAKKAAIKAAKTLGILAHPGKVEEVIEGIVGLAVNASSSFLLKPFIGFIVGTLENQFQKENLVKQGLRVLYGRQNRLLRLAESPPGRISTYRQTITMREDICGMSFSV